MGCCVSAVSPEMDHRQSRINRQLEMDRLRAQASLKILTLGTGEAGKSTFIKQLNFIYKRKISMRERAEYIDTLQRNTIACMKDMINIADELKLDFPTDELKQAAELIRNTDQLQKLTKDLAEYVSALWNSDVIKECWEERERFWHLENAWYYLSQCQRFVETDYVPTDEDMIMCRKRTTGITMTDFELDRVDWAIIDVGGQRSERRKWMQCFTDHQISALIWMVNLADYNLILFEDKHIDRMHEALNTFADSVKLFKDLPIFLVFNKKDLFEMMIKKKGLETCFPEFKGQENNVENCIQFLTSKFRACLPKGVDFAMHTYITARARRDVEDTFEEIRAYLVKYYDKTLTKGIHQIQEFEKKQAETMIKRRKESIVAMGKGALTYQVPSGPGRLTASLSDQSSSALVSDKAAASSARTNGGSQSINTTAKGSPKHLITVQPSVSNQEPPQSSHARVFGGERETDSLVDNIANSSRDSSVETDDGHPVNREPIVAPSPNGADKGYITSPTVPATSIT